MQITADIGKILKYILGDLTFIFDVLSQSLIGFVSFQAFLTVENVVSSTKSCFYQKQIIVTLRKYVEMFHVNIGHNLAQKFLTRYLSYRK